LLLRQKGEEGCIHAEDGPADPFSLSLLLRPGEPFLETVLGVAADLARAMKKVGRELL